MSANVWFVSAFAPFSLLIPETDVNVNDHALIARFTSTREGSREVENSGPGLLKTQKKIKFSLRICRRSDITLVFLLETHKNRFHTLSILPSKFLKSFGQFEENE